MNDEMERLCALPVTELAAAILLGWAQRATSQYPANDLANWLLGGCPAIIEPS